MPGIAAVNIATATMNLLLKRGRLIALPRCRRRARRSCSRTSTPRCAPRPRRWSCGRARTRSRSQPNPLQLIVGHEDPTLSAGPVAAPRPPAVALTDVGVPTTAGQYDQPAGPFPAAPQLPRQPDGEPDPQPQLTPRGGSPLQALQDLIDRGGDDGMATHATSPRRTPQEEPPIGAGITSSSGRCNR